MSAPRFHELTVARVSPEAAGSVAITFAVPQELHEQFSFEPGQFLTLRSLMGDGAQFFFEGEKEGNGSYAGRWLKLRRVAPGAAEMHFWLAFQRGADGGYQATWPGIVRILGDPSRNLPTEDYILRSWKDPQRGAGQSFRYPEQIDAYSLLPGRAPLRFLRATVRDIKINVGIDPARFLPPGGR